MTDAADPNNGPAPRGGLGWTLAPLVIFAAIAGMFAYALQSGDPSKLPSALIGKPVPAIAFEPLDGLVAAGMPVPGFAGTELARGKPSVVNFWASWCVPCVREHPLLAKLVKETGVAIYGVNYKDDTAAARRFLGVHGNPFTAVGTDPRGRGAIEWGVYGMPETFVIDGAGRIAYKHVGPMSEQSLEQQVIPAVRRAQGTK